MSDERAARIVERLRDTVIDGMIHTPAAREIIAAEYADVIAENERLKAGWDADAALCKEYHLQALRFEKQVAELRPDAERYRQGISAFAHKLCVRADGVSLWRYCEPDPLVGHTFDEAWDAAIDAARSR